MMNVNDAFGFAGALATGAAILARAHLLGQRNRGWYGLPQWTLVPMLACTLAEWVRCGMIAINAKAGLHASISETWVHATFAASSGALLVDLVVASWRRYARGLRSQHGEALVEPDTRTVPEQIAEAMKPIVAEAVREALAASSEASRR